MARIARRLLRPLRRTGAAWRARTEDHGFPAMQGGLRRHLDLLPAALFAPQAPVVQKILPLYLEHRFNLLGSGWVRVAHAERYAGFGPYRYGPGSALPPDWRSAGHALPAHRARTQALVAMISPDYVPLDWQVDFKSGWRWDHRALGVTSPIGHKPGADIKLPWELARLQHLATLAAGYALGGQPGFAAADVYAREFCDVVLDFIVFNPPGFGVNWACAMDVAIRAANIALSWDLFCALGAKFDTAFEAGLASSLLAHGRFVRENLEWHGGARANHYLADMAGLAFIAAYLPQTDETRGWKAFAARELDQEIRFQFLPDGAGFEGSTAYHGLSGELAVFASALLAGEGINISAESQQRLAGSLRFSRAITKPDHTIVQIGDNDSGHFLKLTALFNLLGLEESHLDQRRFQSAAAALLGEGDGSLEAAVIAQLSRGHSFAATAPVPATASQPFTSSPARRCFRVTIQSRLGGLKQEAFPDFGLYVWRGADSFISIRCGRRPDHDVHGAHVHNDQLAVELFLNGVAWTRDPGSFVYTPDIKARDSYRSASAHFAPHGPHEPGDLSAGSFRLEDRSHARVLYFKGREFLGAHEGFGQSVFRRVRLEANGLTIEDLYGGSEIVASSFITEYNPASPAELAALWELTLPFSPGYGLQEADSSLSK